MDGKGDRETYNQHEQTTVDHKFYGQYYSCRESDGKHDGWPRIGRSRAGWPWEGQ